MGKGSNQTTTNSNSMSSTSPDSNAYQAYLSLLNRAGGVASTPYQGYTGQEVAPVNDQQQAGIGNINAISGTNSPFISQITGAGQPLTAQQIQQYENPYTNDVVNATQAQFNNQNAQQQSQVTGNAAAQGALGGDRSAVAAALTAGQQQMAQAPVIAGLQSQGYNQAVSTAENEQKQALASGVAGQSAAQGAAGAQIGAGTLQQTTQQAQDTQARQDYYQQQGYPFQVAQWLASIDTGVGSNMGGTSTNTGQSTTTPPTPNPWTQAAGIGLAGAGLFLKRGGRISGVHGYAGGGSPYGDVQTWVPQVSGIHGGSGAPPPPSLPSAPAAQKPTGLSADQMKGIGAIGKKAFGAFDNYADPGSADNPLPGLTADDYGSARGGAIRRYANGGFAYGGAPDDDPASFDDRFDAAYPRMAAGVGAARPAFAAMQGDVINPDKPFRMLDRPTEDAEPPALQSYRSGVDQDQQDNAPLPPEVISGRSKPIMARSEPGDDAEGPSQALGYSGSPMIRGVGAPPPQEESPPESGGFLSRLGVHMTPELKQGLLQAGLAMMASGRGGPGSFLQSAGEAGMAGVGAYNKTQQLAQEQEDKLRKQAVEDEKLRMQQETHQQEIGSSPLIRGPNGQMTMNPAWQAMEKWKADALAKDSWAPLPSDGIHPDRMYNKSTGQTKEVPAPKEEDAAQTPSGKFNYVVGGPDVKKGDTLPEPKPLPGYSSQAIKDDAAYYLATGELPKASVSPRNPMGMQSVAYQRLIRNYGASLLAAKGMTEDDFADLRRFGKQAARFPLSKQGDQTVAIGTAIRHINALEEYAKAWDASKGNVNAPILRQAAARFATFLGKSEPTNLEQAARIAGPEIIKAIGVAGAGTGGERIEQEKGFQPGAATEQILGSANVARTFLAGQLPAKEAQAAAVHFPHEKFMSMVGPQEYDYLSAINHGKPANGAPAASTAVPAAPAHPPNAIGTKTDVSGGKWYVDKDGKAISKVP